MGEIEIVQQGESLPFSFDRGDNSIDGWTCLIEVKQFPDDAAIISRPVPAVGNAWPGVITQTESALFSVGLHYLTAKKTNTVTDEKEQEPRRFHVTKAWV